MFGTNLHSDILKTKKTSPELKEGGGKNKQTKIIHTKAGYISE